jgi:hypothetical protein
MAFSFWNASRGRRVRGFRLFSAMSDVTLEIPLLMDDGLGLGGMAGLPAGASRAAKAIVGPSGRVAAATTAGSGAATATVGPGGRIDAVSVGGA